MRSLSCTADRKSNKNAGMCCCISSWQSCGAHVHQRSPSLAGPLLCGENWSIADCVLVPRLYHLTTVARHYKHYDQFDQFPQLSRYMETTFSSQVFKATDYPREWILTGWAKYFT